jgi:serine/threonine-protein kinase
MDGSHEQRQYLQPGPFDQDEGRISPDGKWTAYVSTESGREEVYVQSFPEPGKKRQVSTNGGDFPHWSRDGHEIIYLAGDKLMSATTRPGSSFDSDTPTELFQTRPKTLTYGTPFAPSADGQKFLVNTPIIPPGGPNFVVIQNWTANLGS